MHHFREVLAFLRSLENSGDMLSSLSEANRNNQKLLFCHCCFYTFIAVGLYVNDSCDLYWRGKGLSQEPQQKATGTCFPGVVFFFWWFSDEVQHIVHQIRWNSYSRYKPLWLTWLPSRQGSNARRLGVGAESCFKLIVLVSLACH